MKEESTRPKGIGGGKLDGDRPLDTMKSIRFRSLCIQQISYRDFELYNYTADIQDSAMRHNVIILLSLITLIKFLRQFTVAAKRIH